MVIGAIGLPWLLSDTSTVSPAASPPSSIASTFDRSTCPITLPGDQPFTPVDSTPEGPPASYSSVWYGSPELWTRLGSDGEIWEALPIAADGTLTQKTFWWRQGFSMAEEGQPNITVMIQAVSGGPAIAFGNPGTSGSNPELGQFMLVGISIPDEGCWKITAEYRGSTVSYVTWAERNR